MFDIAPGISVWYPPAGLALALLVMLGPRCAPVVLVTNIVGALASRGFPAWWAPFLFPLLITANYTIVAAVVRRAMGPRLLPGGTRQTLTFVASVILAPVGAAFLGPLIADSVIHVPGTTLIESATHWWIGDVSGILTVTPVVMVFIAPWLEGRSHPLQSWRWDWRFIGTFVAHAATLLGTLWFVFSQGRILGSSTLFLCFLPLIWTCLRHGLPGGTLATLVLVMGSLVALHRSPLPGTSLFSFLVFGLAVVGLGLGLGATVTRRNEAQAELAASEAQLDRVLEGAQLGLWDWNVATGIVTYNTRCAELLHGSRPPISPTRELWELAIHADDRPRHRAALDAHLRNDTALYECEYRVCAPSGRWRWIHSRGSVVHRDAAGTPLLVSGTHVDISDRKRAETAAKRLLSIVETTTDFVLTIDAHGRVIYANKALLGLVAGPNPATFHGTTFPAFFPPETTDRLRTEVIPGAWAKGSWHGELPLRDRDHHEIQASFVAIVHHDAEREGSLLSFVMRDMSVQKQAEAANLERERRILHVQKAESLSVLAGGIAHDFNNLLTAMLGNASLLREDLPAGDAKHGPLAQIEIAAGRASELCNNMLAYAGRFHLTLTEVNVNDVVEESRELIHATVSKKINFTTSLDESLPLIEGSATQLQQVVINLALNANDAIGDHPGEITLRTRYEEFQARGRGAKPTGTLSPVLGQYVLLEVEDTGCGMPEEVRTKIFEPFFTTKSNGHGLGLSAVKGIVRAHRGVIDVQSQPNRGTTFRIWLPALRPADTPTNDVVPVETEWQGSGQALVIDDEPVVRSIVARLVERMGFTVLTANDGVDGVSVFQQHHANLAFVLTDLTMPRMGGDEAMIEMRRINPNVPVLLMSGYPQKMTAGNFVLASPSALLVKPLRLPLLRKTVSQVLATA